MPKRIIALFPALLLSVGAAAQTSTGSPRLDQRAVTARVLAVHPSVAAARQKLVEAQALSGEAASARRPQLTFSGTAGGAVGWVAEPVSSQTYGSVGATVSLALPNGKRLSALGAQGAGAVRAAQASLFRTRRELAFQAADALFAVLRARSARDIAAEDLAQCDRQVADAQKRVDAGDLPPADVLKAQVPVAQARAALLRAQNAVRTAEQQLNSLMGRDLSAAIDLDPPSPPPAVDVPRETVVADALRRSPDIDEANANVASAQAAVDLARHAHDPEWSIDATHARTTDITAYRSLTTVALNVALPLSDGGAARQQVRQAQAQLEQARSALELARRQARLEAEQAWLDVQGARANVVATRETLRIAEDSLAKARQAYQAGLTTTRDVLDAQYAVSQARAEANAAAYDVAVSLAKLDEVMGKEPAL